MVDTMVLIAHVRFNIYDCTLARDGREFQTARMRVERIGYFCRRFTNNLLLQLKLIVVVRSSTTVVQKTNTTSSTSTR